MLIRAILLRTVLLLTLWWGLTGGAPGAWLLGSITVAVAVSASLRLQAPSGRRFPIAGLAACLIFFLAQSVRGGTQVALMALRPRLDLQPAMLEIRLRLSHETEQAFLAGILSLFPGTLSAGLDGNRLKLHVLDARKPVEQEVRAAEERVARLFGAMLS